MNRGLTLFVLLLPAAVALGGCRWYHLQAVVSFAKTHPFGEIRQLEVKTRNGSVDIECMSGQQDVIIQGEKHASGRDEEDALEHAEMVEIRVGLRSDDARVLRIEAEFPDRGTSGRNYGARFKIQIAPEARLELRTSNGAVRVLGGADGADIGTSNGSVTVRDTRGDVVARTSNASIHLSDIDGDTEARSSNGRIRLENVGRRRSRAVTSNASIDATGVNGDAYLQSSNGRIRLRLDRVTERPQLSAITSNGSVLVEVPRTISADLRMRTTNSRAEAELDGVAITDLRQSKDHLSAVLNDGRGSVEIRSTNGSVRIEAIPGAVSR